MGSIRSHLNICRVLNGQAPRYRKSLPMIDLEPIGTGGVQVDVHGLAALVLDAPVDSHGGALQRLDLARDAGYKYVVGLDSAGGLCFPVDPDGERFAFRLPVFTVDVQPLPALVIRALLNGAHIGGVPIMPVKEGPRQRHLQRTRDEILHPHGRVRPPEMPRLFVGGHSPKVC